MNEKQYNTLKKVSERARFDRPINRDSITEFWEKIEQNKRLNVTETMLEVIKGQLNARNLGKGELSNTEKELLLCLAEALLETQTKDSLSKYETENTIIRS